LRSLEGKIVLITGGTGSFGKCFTRHLLNHSVGKVIIYSRDEMKQWNMASEIGHDTRVEFVIGDVRDQDRLMQSMSGVDCVVHAAATKIVPTAEYHPTECIKTNIIGAMNVIEAAKRNSVKAVVALSTDKASNPINLYGATKLASDKLFVAANLARNNSTIFSVVRYGNVMGSRGSVIPFFLSVNKNQPLPITDPKMTRFMITLDQGVELVLQAIDEAVGGEIFVKKIPSMNIIDIAKAVRPNLTHNIIGIRPGEKLHEQMIGIEDSSFTFEYQDYYKILPNLNNWHTDSERIRGGEKVSNGFLYSSDKNQEWMSGEELRGWIEKNISSLHISY
jgi:UDP-N-acetylglucosamine 4,6-dehydratase/5-epimerase